MKTRHLRSGLLALLAVAITSGRASAAVVDATSTTLLQGRAEPADGSVRSVVPIIELVGLSATNIDSGFADDLTVQLDLWGRTNLQNQAARDATRLGDAADVNLAYVSGKLFDRTLGLTLGRHMVFGGAARSLQLDGASAEVKVYRGLGVQAYGGLPVIPRFAVANGDVVGGGRLFYRSSIDAEVGASFIQINDHGYTARQDLGVDGRWVLGRNTTGPVTLGALAMFSTAAGRLSEADASVAWQPSDPWELKVNVRRTAPDLFLPLTSVFSVFASERRDEYGGSVSWSPIRPLNLWADYHYLSFGAESGTGENSLGDKSGHLGALRGTWSLGTGSLVGAQARLLSEPHNGYANGRLFGMAKATDTIGVSLDLDAYHFEKDINAERNSYVASASGTWQFAPSWMAVVTGLGSVTPYFEHRLEVLAKVVYNFSTRVREVNP